MNVESAVDSTADSSNLSVNVSDEPVVLDVEVDDEPDEEAVAPSKAVAEPVALKPIDSPVMPIAISDDAEDDSDDQNVSDDTEEDALEDKRVYADADGNKIYVTYDYSFRAKLIRASEEVQSRHAVISDTLSSYGLELSESWKKETYAASAGVYASMIFKGNTLCLCLAISPESLEATKYFFENMGGVKGYEATPVMVKIRSGRGCKYALELIKMMMDGAGIGQIRGVADTYTFHNPLDKAQLIENGYIKVAMTDANGQTTDALKNTDLTLTAGMPILNKVSVEDVATIPDSEVVKFIETEMIAEDDISGIRKENVNIDAISAVYKDGDTVSLESLIAKKLVAKNVGSVKILACGELDKALTVKANDFSIDAAKMIIVAGGRAVKLKSGR